MLGDGIFDHLTDKEVTECVWLTIQESVRGKNLHLQCGVAVDMILKSSLLRKTLDNVTCVLIVFENFERCYNNNSSNFTFSTINSNLSTFNTLNSPNNHTYTESKEDNKYIINNNKTKKIISSYNNEISKLNEETLLSNNNNIANLGNSYKFNSNKKLNNISYNDNIPYNNGPSPYRVRSSKPGLNLEHCNINLLKSTAKFTNIPKNEVENLSNNLISSNLPLKVKNYKQKLNYSEDSKIVEANRFPIAYKKNESLIKMSKK